MRFSAGRHMPGAMASLVLLSVGVLGTGASAGPVPTVAPEAAPAPVRAMHLWSADALRELADEVRAAEREGLDSAAYDLPALDAAIVRGESADTDRIATAAALALARDYLQGRVADRSRFGWHIERGEDGGSLAAGLQGAVRDGRVQPWLRSLLPSDPRYAALRAAYAGESDPTMRDRLRANLERWRWMPRRLGDDHIYVNVPSYTLDLVEDGKPVTSYTVVVGAPKTPTPQIASHARALVVNPWWNVPRSIAGSIRPGAGKGYVFSGGAVRQRPGPGNALGKVKIDMPNPHAIYLHDTPSKHLFGESSRAFSHGCIRVKDVERLAAELAERDAGDADAVRQALAGSATRTLALPKARPVYLVYFTLDAAPDGAIVRYEDPYGRDAKLIASLDRPVRYAARAAAAATATGS
ncbi:L,D-transpeptidase family protein [Sphingomonas sp. LY54]|uniref:L,D-transpeptidase family protein n=1 Tax=Sphingomonas sp. LY54 TaxID=3095343 RepID=UPI002D77F838|nr:L,D-transpeptidase family protein [Sphingomonas sp. LY54]WRP28528.1 L,D-transpeptidase family protein [Sphingomonas sp. LY54]